MYTPGYEGRIQGFGPTEAKHRQLKHAVDEAGARVRTAETTLNTARGALLETVTASTDAQKKNGNLASAFVKLMSETKGADAELPACTEDLDTEVMVAATTFAVARREYDEARLAATEANRAFGQHLGHTGQ